MKNTFFLSIFVAVLILTACSNGGDKTPDGKVFYEPEYISVTSEMEMLDAWCVSGGNGYMLCRERNLGSSPYVIERISADGGVETLPEYQPIKPLSDESASVNYFHRCSLQPWPDGTLWESAVMNIHGYDEETKKYWEDDIPVLRHLDKDGKELSRIDFDADLAEDSELGYFYKFIVDGEGTVFVDYERGLAMLDDKGNIVFSDSYSRLTNSPIAILSDGRIGVLFSERSIIDDADVYTLRTIDKEKQEWGNSFRLNGNGMMSVFSGDENALFYYMINSTLYAWQEGSEEGEQILNLLDPGVDSSNLYAVTGRSDGEIVLFTQNGRQPDSIQMVRLTPTATAREKKILTLATTHMWTSLEDKILEFNRNNQEYHISVTDYSQYGGYHEAMTRLATEIVAGNVPDLMTTYQIPVAQWAASGLLEDLWPYIDNDTEIERDGLMIRALEAAEIDGKLYEISSDFQISTLVGAKDVVGDRMTWTMKDMMDALKTMPEGCIPFSYRDKTGLLTSLIDWSRFVDWENGTCSFDSEEFRALMEFCKNMPENTAQSGHTTYEDLLDKQQMLIRATHTGFTFPALAKMLLGGEISYIGYPNTYGGAGSSFVLSDEIVMCSASKEKDGAWAFMRMYLLPQEKDYNSTISFPINKADFERMAEEAMEPKYKMSANGDYILDENGEKIPEIIAGVQNGSFAIDIYTPLTQADYDQIIELYNTIERSSMVDSDLQAIVTEVSGAYFAGDMTLDRAAELIQNRANLCVNERL